MMLPPKKLNIYPRSNENIEALISFYFDDLDIAQDGALEELNKYSSLSINQIEYILKKLTEAYETIFTKHLAGKITLKNLIAYGIDALHNSEASKSGSQNRQNITNKFTEYVKQTEANLIHFEKIIK